MRQTNRDSLRSAKQANNDRTFFAKLEYFDSLTKGIVDKLKQEPPELIERVLTRNRALRRLPTWLAGEFPSLSSLVIDDRAGGLADLQSELKWTAARLSSNSDRLNSYLSLRTTFAEHVVLGNMSSAADILAQCRKNFGESLWLLESELLLAEAAGGFDANRESLSQIFGRGLPPNVHLLAEFASQRVDATISPARYLQTVSRFIASGDYSRIHPCFSSFLELTLAPQLEQVGKLSADAAALYLHMNSSLPIIDQYTAAVKLMRYLLSHHQSDFFDHIKGYTGLERIRDPDLSNILIFGTNSQLKQLDQAYLNAQREYFEGRYASVVATAIGAISSTPLHLGWYDLLARSSILANQELPDCLPDRSIAKSILHYIHTYYHFGDLTNSAFSLLSKCALERVF